MLGMYFNTFYGNVSHHPQIPVFVGNSQKSFTHVPYLWSEKIPTSYFQGPSSLHFLQSDSVIHYLLHRIILKPDQRSSSNVISLLIYLIDTSIYSRTLAFSLKRDFIYHICRVTLLFWKSLEKGYFVLVYPDLLLGFIKSCTLLQTAKNKNVKTQ